MPNRKASDKNLLLMNVLLDWNYEFYQEMFGKFGLLSIVLEIIFYVLLKYLVGFHESTVLRFGSALLIGAFVFLPKGRPLLLWQKVYIEFAYFIGLPLCFYYHLLMNQVNNYWFASMAFCGFIHGLLGFQLVGVSIYTMISCVIAIVVRYFPDLLSSISIKNFALAHVVCTITFVLSALIRVMLQFGYRSLALVQNELIRTQEEIIRQKTEEAQNLKLNAALGALATQIAHDIRSPLAALNTAFSDLSSYPEETRSIIRIAVQRINDIANTLLDRKRDGQTLVSENSGDLVISPKTERVLLCQVIDSILTEKRAQYRNRIGFEIETIFEGLSYSLFSTVEERELKRLLSNLINNAWESLVNGGRVRIRLAERLDKHAVISVEDNGKGIPQELIPKLFEIGASFGKAGGTGLGLHHAKTHIEKWGGTIEVESKVGVGTNIRLLIPKAPVPSWFVDKIVLRSGMKVIIVDDDSMIHEIWKHRFSNLGITANEMEILNYSRPQQLYEYIHQSKRSDEELFLIDYEFLGEKITGLELVESLGIENGSILVTSRYEELNTSFNERGSVIRLMPKSMAAIVAIEIKSVVPAN